MKDQESNPRPHIPRPAALPVKDIRAEIQGLWLWICYAWHKLNHFARWLAGLIFEGTFFMFRRRFFRSPPEHFLMEEIHGGTEKIIDVYL